MWLPSVFGWGSYWLRKEQIGILFDTSFKNQPLHCCVHCAKLRAGVLGFWSHMGLLYELKQQRFSYFYNVNSLLASVIVVGPFRRNGCRPAAGIFSVPRPPIYIENLVKLIISRAATARLVSLTRLVATYTPTRRGGSADYCDFQQHLLEMMLPWHRIDCHCLVQHAGGSADDGKRLPGDGRFIYCDS